MSGSASIVWTVPFTFSLYSAMDAPSGFGRNLNGVIPERHYEARSAGRLRDCATASPLRGGTRIRRDEFEGGGVEKPRSGTHFETCLCGGVGPGSHYAGPVTVR